MLTVWLLVLLAMILFWRFFLFILVLSLVTAFPLPVIAAIGVTALVFIAFRR